MVAAIGSGTLPTSLAASTATSPTSGLEAQIVRYQKELSDCVNCDSANTAQGKETIQAISNKISAARARIEEIQLTQSINQPARVDSQAATTSRQDAVMNNPVDQAGSVSSRPLQSGSATLGSVINVVA